jgi:hypothetical protein
VRDHFAKLAPADNAHADGPVHGNEVAIDHKLRVNWSRETLKVFQLGRFFIAGQYMAMQQ